MKSLCFLIRYSPRSPLSRLLKTHSDTVLGLRCTEHSDPSLNMDMFVVALLGEKWSKGVTSLLLFQIRKISLPCERKGLQRDLDPDFNTSSSSWKESKTIILYFLGSWCWKTGPGGSMAFFVRDVCLSVQSQRALGWSVQRQMDSLTIWILSRPWSVYINVWTHLECFLIKVTLSFAFFHCISINPLVIITPCYQAGNRCTRKLLEFLETVRTCVQVIPKYISLWTRSCFVFQFCALTFRAQGV